MRRYRYFIVDVFTSRAFGGNQLAVLPDARELAPGTMQQIAREFNFAETTFVLPPEAAENTRRVRIFTPQLELPFAGHPNIGTAFALAASGEVAHAGTRETLRFEELAGVVPVTVEFDGDAPVRAELTAPRTPEVGEPFDARQVALALALGEGEVVTTRHPPQLASAGIPFLFVELSGLEALGRAWPVHDRAPRLLPRETAIGFLLYTRETAEEGVDLRARMYAPEVGVPEDPATGSAAVAMAGLLASLDHQRDGELRWRIAQGVEMGRPSVLEATAVKKAGAVIETRVGGAAVMVSEGTMNVPDAAGRS